MSKVVDYRRWRGDGGKEQTVFFFDKTAGKNKTIADIPVGTVDDVLGTKKLKEYEELVG
jgi:hypothetical protein